MSRLPIGDTRLVACVADELDRVLPQTLVTRTEELVAVESDWNLERAIGPDVRMFSPASIDPASSGSGALLDAPFKLVVEPRSGDRAFHPHPRNVRPPRHGDRIPEPDPQARPRSRSVPGQAPRAPPCRMERSELERSLPWRRRLVVSLRCAESNLASSGEPRSILADRRFSCSRSKRPSSSRRRSRTAVTGTASVAATATAGGSRAGGTASSMVVECSARGDS
jgi:hypothetical protein